MALRPGTVGGTGGGSCGEHPVQPGTVGTEPAEAALPPQASVVLLSISLAQKAQLRGFLFPCPPS